MKRLALLVLLAAASGAPEALAQAPRVHVVQPGETLYRIATTNGVTVAELKAFNGLAGDTIQVGQRLRLPGDARPAPSGPTPSDPIPSDPAPADPTPEADPEEATGPPPTDRPDITPTDVEPIRPVAPVRLGDGDERPQASGETPQNARIHTVVRGETLFRIALRYDTTVDALRRLNGIRGDQIEVG
ncbi:MAG: LysM peptidoglycan-binding domain-containing protein, partial [Bacteroidota bacterium]